MAQHLHAKINSHSLDFSSSFCCAVHLFQQLCKIIYSYLKRPAIVVFRSLLWFTINYVALSCARGISLRSATPRRSALAAPCC